MVPRNRIRLIIYPYNLGSKSAKLLAETLDATRVRPDGNYRHRPGHLIINWGNSQLPKWGTQLALHSMLNKPQYVQNASEKVKTFQTLASTMSAHLPDWTTDINVARGWLSGPPKYPGKKHAVVCRTLTRANSGRGIVVADDAGSLIAAPLYTRYKPKTAEYRIHVSRRFGIIDIQQKRRRNGEDITGIGEYIRSWDNGWVFCREDVDCPDSVAEVAESSLHALNLDFGAVDIGYHPSFGISLYEINTAAGIEGHTLTNYATMFRRYANY